MEDIRPYRTEETRNDRYENEVRDAKRVEREAASQDDDEVPFYIPRD
jgi:hypothetical protein